MKRIIYAVLALLLMYSLAWGQVGPFPNKEFGQNLGKDGRSYSDLYIKNKIIFEGATSNAYEGTLAAPDVGADYTWTFPSKSGTIAMTTDVSTAASAWDDLTSPDAAKTHAMTTYAQTFTSTKTDGDMFLFKGLGAFGDVSVLRVEQSTGNATDGTVLEVISADTDVDAFLVTANSTDVLLIGGGGTMVINTSDWDISATGAMTNIASVGFDNSSVLYMADVSCNNACVKGLRAAPKELVATPGAGKYIELVSAQIILDYGSNVLTESTDNLVIEYATSGQDATAAIETTGFIDQAADQMAFILPAGISTVPAANVVNNALQLFNTGDGEFGGNGGNDSTLKIKIVYRVHSTGL